MGIMKILIYNNLVYGGGVERLFPLLADGLRVRGHKITVMASSDSKNDFKSVFSQEINCICTGLNYRSFDNKFKACLYFMKKKAYKIIALLRCLINKYDVVIAFKEGHVLKNALKIRARKRYAWIHTDLTVFCSSLGFTIPFSGIGKLKKCLGKYDRVVCVSETARRSVLEMVGDTGNLCVRLDPLDWREIRTQALEEPPTLKNHTCPLIVSVGRLDPNKNIMLLLEACKTLCEKLDFETWIVGDGPQREEIEEYIQNNNLGCAKLLGFQLNPFPIVKQADLYVSTSLSESYGLAIQEALILGVPVVAVKCPGIIESWDPGFGKLVDNSAEELADTIYQLLTNPDELENYHKTIKERYPLHMVFEDRIDKICRLIEGSEE